MTQTAPGRYQAEFDTPHPGSYHLEFSQKRDGQVLYHQSRGLAVGYPDELRLRPTNTGLLRVAGARLRRPVRPAGRGDLRGRRRARPCGPRRSGPTWSPRPPCCSSPTSPSAGSTWRRWRIGLRRKISVPSAAR